MSTSLRRLALVLYCVALWLTFDLIYSFFIYTDMPNLRRRDAQYDHGFRPKVEGPAVFGPLRYTIHTDSLGFRSDAIRDVPLRSSVHRVLLIGDSFIEGVGLQFEDTLAGLLVKAGLQRTEPIEFLNAGVASYSPVLYYKRVKSLIESGLVFDEVVVLPDVSDVHDEATAYFCFDDDPRYRAYCPIAGPIVIPAEPETPSVRSWGLQRWFAGTNAIRSMIEQGLRKQLGLTRRHRLSGQINSAWTIPGYDVGDSYAPLEIEGGIARGLENMQSLADLLAARDIPLTLAVYPWPMQIALDDAEKSRHVTTWREFCVRNCKAFINLFPAFFAEKEKDSTWYERLFISGDVHFSAEGNRVMFRELAMHLLPDRSERASTRQSP